MFGRKDRNVQVAMTSELVLSQGAAITRIVRLDWCYAYLSGFEEGEGDYTTVHLEHVAEVDREATALELDHWCIALRAMKANGNLTAWKVFGPYSPDELFSLMESEAIVEMQEALLDSMP